MPVLKAARTAQTILAADFTFNFDDTAIDSVTLASKTFGAVFGDAIIFDAIPMPQGAVVVGGELIIETAGVGPTVYTVKLGVAGNDACYLAATSLLSAANTRAALLLTTALASNGGANMRMTIASTVANATAGKFRLRVQYTIDRRASENNIA